DYPLSIIQYKDPMLLDKPFNIIRGVPIDLRFIIAFNGTKLCAIKIFDAETGRPIRDSWTPYLRGWDDFSVVDSQVVVKKHVFENLSKYQNIKNIKIIFEFFPGISLETVVKVI
ncbi:MAG: endoglucanase, partial [Dictyoglomus turgidum]